jgi:1-acyl-sn-glycerol-3-phosphate acyltransferase
MGHPFTPKFVTRRRYARFVPAVSLSVRLAGCPVIEPRERMGALAVMQRTSRDDPHGILIFPEGHRSRDGEIGPFRAAGTLVALTERRRPVYLAVSDGFWTCCRLVDFLFNVHKIRGETEVLGPFDPPQAPEELAGFVEHLRQLMIDHLKAMRERGGA